MVLQDFDSVKNLAKYALVLLVPAAALAQDVISARAGMINLIEGHVVLEGEPLLIHPGLLLHIEPGQRLQTLDGRAEVLFAVGTYLWLAEHSEIEMVSAGLSAAKLRLRRGSMIIESHAVFDESSLAVLASDGEVHFPKAGLYRLDVTGTDDPSLTVVKGQALLVADGVEHRAKKKRTLRFGGPTGAVSETSFKRWREDQLAAWYAKRAGIVAPEPVKGDGLKEYENRRVVIDSLPDRGRAGIKGPYIALPF